MTIVQEIIESGGYFALMADEVRDSANKEQLAVTLRFTDIKGMLKTVFDTNVFFHVKISNLSIK